MAIGDYLSYLNPTNYNVFGVENPNYSGLLDTEQSKALSQRSNIAGLLGAAAALAQGMSKQGPRRSGVQNVLSALGAGYGASGQAYQGGIEQMANAQKLAQLKLQMEQNAQTQQAINNLLQDPAIASDPSAVAYIRSNPADAIKQYAEQRAFQRERESIKQNMFGAPPAPAQYLSQGEGATLPSQAVGGNKEIAILEQQIQNSLADAAAYGARRDSTKQKAALESADKLREMQANLLVGDVDIRSRIENAPEAFKQQYKTIADLKEARVLKGKEFLDAIQKVDTAVQESGKQYRYDGNTGQYAYLMFGTNDATKLTPDQNRNILAFSNAPNQADLLNNAIAAQKLKAETGIGVPMPISREQYLKGQVTTPSASVSTVAPSAEPAPAVQPTQARVVTPRPAPPPMANAPEPRVPANLQRTGEPTAAAPTALVDIGNKIPLIKQPDIKVPLKTKQKLLEEQGGATNATSYALTNIKDARDVAKSLLNNANYIKALSGPFAPKLTQLPIGDAYDAKQILDNLLGRSFVNEISEMRANSPTGGAVGNVAVAEMEALSKIRAALKVGMSEKELKNQLQTYINNADRALQGIPKRYAEIYGYEGQFDNVLSGTVIPNGQQGDPIARELQRRKDAAKRGKNQ